MSRRLVAVIAVIIIGSAVFSGAGTLAMFSDSEQVTSEFSTTTTDDDSVSTVTTAATNQPAVGPSDLEESADTSENETASSTDNETASEKDVLEDENTNTDFGGDSVENTSERIDNDQDDSEDDNVTENGSDNESDIHTDANRDY
ncbi:hypothetical protein G6M89_17270 [Natronolimnobius sp. AArcel1]|uniref:hypothetical protein n=1 Tax=Natronolimnobius sp. AArcel1 TaxID=1679093 RepID=UPI0013EB0D42|nr:hypothetical protein [Natronolimnobius sp. AArcel1]NGM70735.1 hypothetical protein [Natronolimnobius sp. AArcel1]